MSRVARILVAAAVVALLAAAAGYASSTSPKQRDSSVAVQAHRGGTLKLLAKSAGGTLDPQVNYTLQYWQLYQASVRRPARLHQGRRQRRVRRRARHRDSAAELRRTAARLRSSRSARGSSSRTARRSRRRTSSPPSSASSRSRARRPAASTPASSARTPVSRQPATCTLKGGVSANNAAGTVTINLTAPDPEFKYKLAVPHAAIVPASSPSTDAGTKPIAGHGRVLLRVVQPEQAAGHEAQPVLQAVVEAGAARRVSRRDHPVLRSDDRGADHRNRERSGRLDARGAAGRPPRRDRHEVRRPGARRAR